MEAFERIVVRYDGQCLWMVPFVFKTICKIDVTYFPFDEQICEFEIGSWAYTGAYLNITYKNANGDLSQYSENSAWEVLSKFIIYQFNNCFVLLNFKLERKAGHGLAFNFIFIPFYLRSVDFKQVLVFKGPSIYFTAL